METLRKIVLASSSVYRRELLKKLVPEFDCASPEIDESAGLYESPTKLSERLAIEKARALATVFPDALIIGSDQVAMLDGIQLQKPGNRENCMAQLTAASGRIVDFFTSVCVIDARTGAVYHDQDHTRVYFRNLSDAQISHYVDREQPYDCAGGFKSEGLGIALFDRIEGDDPNALIGLPLIRLCRLLHQAGYSVL